MKELRVLIVCEHASQLYGGEAILPLHYFKRLREKKIDVWLITHSRVKSHLMEVMPENIINVYFIPDTFLHVFLNKVGKKLPSRISVFTTGFISHIVTQIYQFRIARKLVKEKNISVVHEPAPVSPKQPSFMFCLGAPVLIGPLNGGMNFPQSFLFMQNKYELVFYRVARTFSILMNCLIPGKVLADVLLVANKRTENALPLFRRGKVVEVVENGVDLSIWEFRKLESNKKTIQFVYMGRLVDWKCIDLLIKAFSMINGDAKLLIIGDGELMGSLKALSVEYNCSKNVEFLGWLSQTECSKKLTESDVLVLPSVRECGGAVVLEAMAVGLPVIAVNWGGPADYISSETGILIEPSESNIFINDLSEAMQLLVAHEDKRVSMGMAGRARVEAEFDWDKKVDQMIDTYKSVI